MRYFFAFGIVAACLCVALHGLLPRFNESAEVDESMLQRVVTKHHSGEICFDQTILPNGKLHGRSRMYDPRGRLRADSLWHYGVLQECRRYNTEGALESWHYRDSRGELQARHVITEPVDVFVGF